MPKSATQSDRLQAERNHPPPPPAQVVELRYRLQPTDLPAGLLRGAIARVTQQGVETVTPVLHLRGAPKPLLLDGENIRRMAAITGSPLHQEWVGKEVQVRVIAEEGRPTLRIFAATAADSSAEQAPRPPQSRLRGVLILLLVLLLAFSAVYLVENWGEVAALFGVYF